MFNGQLCVKIYGSDTKDTERLNTAINVLTEIADAFSKMGSNTETEVYDLEHACNVLYDVMEGKYF